MPRVVEDTLREIEMSQPKRYMEALAQTPRCPRWCRAIVFRVSEIRIVYSPTGVLGPISKALSCRAAGRSSAIKQEKVDIAMLPCSRSREPPKSR